MMEAYLSYHQAPLTRPAHAVSSVSSQASCTWRAQPHGTRGLTGKMATTLSRTTCVEVRAAATKSLKRPGTVPRQTTPRQAKASSAAPSGTSLRILKRVQELQLLSKVEQLGLLSKLEKSGLTLSKIEEAGLLSFAEKSGVLSLVADEKTPGLLNVTGVALVGLAAALVYFVGDDSTGAVVAQAVGAVTMGAAGIAALVAGSTLEKFQKL